MVTVKKFQAFLLLIIFPFILQAQNYGKYWVFFKDKSDVDFNPHEFFDPKAIERRLKHGLPLDDFSDLPVTLRYIEAVSEIADSTGVVSRWFNGMVFWSDEYSAGKISEFSFVAEVIPVPANSVQILSNGTSNEIYDVLNPREKQLLACQVASLGEERFSEKGYDGKGVRVAIFDAGFPGVDKHPAFEHIRANNRIIKTWDFVKKQENVYRADSHGTMVLSCVGGMVNGRKTGLATSAEFLLARTERAHGEPFSEEENWLAAAEWADKNGAHIINSSLGYTYHRYFRSQMDGNTSLVARAANMAASKGVLVVNAAGNDGFSRWEIIGTPADADSVLAVGGIDPYTFFHVNFSSFGPTAKKIMKPNVSAYGIVIAANPKKLGNTQGTSFSSPLVAGFAACALQAKPHLKNMELFREIEMSGELYPYYDYAHGFGIPQADWFTGEKMKEEIPTFIIEVDKVNLKVMIKEEYFDQLKIIASPETINNEEFCNESLRKHYLYYHIENKSGYLDKYFVINVEKADVLELNVNEFTPGQTLRIHYRGYTETYKF